MINIKKQHFRIFIMDCKFFNYSNSFILISKRFFFHSERFNNIYLKNDYVSRNADCRIIKKNIKDPPQEQTI